MGNFAICNFPGIRQVLRCSMSFTTGITPSSAILEIAPQADFTDTIGDLVFSDGDTTITFKDCKLDTNSFELNHMGWFGS